MFAISSTNRSYSIPTIYNNMQPQNWWDSRSTYQKNQHQHLEGSVKIFEPQPDRLSSELAFYQPFTHQPVNNRDVSRLKKRRDNSIIDSLLQNNNNSCSLQYIESNQNVQQNENNIDNPPSIERMILDIQMKVNRKSGFKPNLQETKDKNKQKFEPIRDFSMNNFQTASISTDLNKVNNWLMKIKPNYQNQNNNKNVNSQIERKQLVNTQSSERPKLNRPFLRRKIPKNISHSRQQQEKTQFKPQNSEQLMTEQIDQIKAKNKDLQIILSIVTRYSQQKELFSIYQLLQNGNAQIIKKYISGLLNIK